MLTQNQLYSRNVTEPTARKATTVAHQIKQARDWAAAQGLRAGAIPKGQYAFGTTSSARANTVRDLEDYPLVELAAGVAHMPTGGDRGLLTAAIELALSRNENTVTLSQLDAYIQANRAHLHIRHAMSTDSQAYDRWFGAGSPDAQRVRNHLTNIGYTRT